MLTYSGLTAYSVQQPNLGKYKNYAPTLKSRKRIASILSKLSSLTLYFGQICQKNNKFMQFHKIGGKR